MRTRHLNARQQPETPEQVVDAAIALRWRDARRMALAIALACFPFLFIMDAWWDPAFSPVIPGLIVVALIWVAGPLGAMELWSRKPIRREREQRRHARSKYMLGTSAAWLLLWLVFLL